MLSTKLWILQTKMPSTHWFNNTIQPKTLPFPCNTNHWLNTTSPHNWLCLSFQSNFRSRLGTDKVTVCLFQIFLLMLIMLVECFFKCLNCFWVLVYTAWSRYFQFAGEFVAHQLMHHSVTNIYTMIFTKPTHNLPVTTKTFGRV